MRLKPEQIQLTGTLTQTPQGCGDFFYKLLSLPGFKTTCIFSAPEEYNREHTFCYNQI